MEIAVRTHFDEAKPILVGGGLGFLCNKLPEPYDTILLGIVAVVVFTMALKLALATWRERKKPAA